ncbi:MAG: hypothetical protein LBT40_17330 [Deltaproteobacteria bacterium]|nr:hypothetical protein [Deltaproteobacteria bacterium]
MAEFGLGPRRPGSGPRGGGDVRRWSRQGQEVRIGSGGGGCEVRRRIRQVPGVRGATKWAEQGLGERPAWDRTRFVAGFGQYPGVRIGSGGGGGEVRRRSRQGPGVRTG